MLLQIVFVVSLLVIPVWEIYDSLFKKSPIVVGIISLISIIFITSLMTTQKWRAEAHHLCHLVNINISSVNKNQKKYFPFVQKNQKVASRAILCARAIFSGVTRIQTHNLSLTCTLPYHWTIPSHVTNNQIFFFCHHFLISYITCFTGVTISNEKLFN